jgi:hypothetical protein
VSSRTAVLEGLLDFDASFEASARHVAAIVAVSTGDAALAEDGTHWSLGTFRRSEYGRTRAGRARGTRELPRSAATYSSVSYRLIGTYPVYERCRRRSHTRGARKARFVAFT